MSRSNGWVTATYAELSGFQLISEEGYNEAATPDFSANGEALEFGYATANSSGSHCTRDWGADNWSVSVGTR